jgi:hypothetical protein
MKANKSRRGKAVSIHRGGKDKELESNIDLDVHN